MAIPNNIKDRELDKFVEDGQGNTAVNVVFSGNSGNVFQLINCCGLLDGIASFTCIEKTTNLSGNDVLDYKNSLGFVVRRILISYGPGDNFSICIVGINNILTEDDQALLTEDDQPIELE